MTMPGAGRPDERGRFPKKAVILLLVTTYILALGYNTPPIQCVSGTLSFQVKRLGREDAQLLVDDYIASVIHERIRNMSGIIMTGEIQSTRRNSCVSATRPPPP
jgi:hypothetical protein